MRYFFTKSFAILLLILSQTSFADTGKVLFATGQTFVQRPAQIALNKGDDILIGDTIVTGDKSRVQLLMSDGARISIRANSELNIENYLFTKSSTTTASQSTSTLNLVKGGFRTITGAIASGADKSGYTVKTAVATIGIRGTDYSILFCQGDCKPLEESTNSTIKDGLYAGVSQGAIALVNTVGELQIGATESAYVANQNTMPIKLMGPPRSLFGQTTPIKKPDISGEPATAVLLSDIDIIPPKRKLDETEEVVVIKEVETNDDIAISQVIIDDGTDINIDNGVIDEPDIDEPDSITNEPISFTVASLSGVNVSINETSNLTFDAQNNLTGFLFNASSGENINIGTAQSLNNGFDEITGFRWGRWSLGVASFNTGGSLDLTEQSLHWLSNDNFNGEVALPQAGQANYSLTGNTDPTNNLGNIGVLGTASFSADFTNQTVSNQILLGINEQVWHANGTGSISNGINQFNGSYTTLINGINNGTGLFSGFFSSMINSQQMPSGAGLTYFLQNNAGTEQVTGNLIFGRQIP